MTKRVKRKFEKSMDWERGMIAADAYNMKSGMLDEPNDIFDTLITLAEVATSTYRSILAREEAGSSYRETYKTACLTVRDAILNIRDFYHTHFKTGGYYGAPRVVFESLFAIAEAMPCDVKSREEFETQLFRIYGVTHTLMCHVYNPNLHRKYTEGTYVWDEDGMTPYHRYWDGEAANSLIDEHAQARGDNITRETFVLTSDN